MVGLISLFLVRLLGFAGFLWLGLYVLTRGGPINSTHLFATLSRVVGIDTGRIGEGAAISLYLFPILVFVVWAQLRFVRKQAY